MDSLTFSGSVFQEGVSFLAEHYRGQAERGDADPCSAEKTMIHRGLTIELAGANGAKNWSDAGFRASVAPICLKSISWQNTAPVLVNQASGRSGLAFVLDPGVGGAGGAGAGGIVLVVEHGVVPGVVLPEDVASGSGVGVNAVVAVRPQHVAFNAFG